MSARDPFTPADYWLYRLAHELDTLKRLRESRRGSEPMPEGGLFDEVRRNTRDLFSEET